MSDTEESSTSSNYFESSEDQSSSNDSKSSEDQPTTDEDIPPLVNTSQVLRDKSPSCPELSKYSGLRTDSSSDEDQPLNLRALRRRILQESAASQENTLNSIEPSELNQSPWTFVCHLNSAKYLKFAVEALRNPEFSTQGEGRIDVDDNGFNMTVQNLTFDVAGHLRLNPARFRCTKPLNGKRFRFIRFYKELANVEDEATVHISNLKETDILNIRSLLEGNRNTRRIFVDMSSNAAEIHKFPDMSLFFTATVPSDEFRIMINHLLQQPLPRQVSVDIKDNTATLSVESDDSWTADYPMLRADGSCGIVAEESYSTTFQWTNAGLAKTLQKASELDTEFMVLFHAERPKNIILRFSLGDVGYLEFMRDSALIVSSTHS